MKPTAHQSILMIWSIYSCICFIVESKTKNCNTFQPVFTHLSVQVSLFTSLSFLNSAFFKDHSNLLLSDNDKTTIAIMSHHSKWILCNDELNVSPG